MSILCANPSSLSSLTPFFLFGLTLVAGIYTWNFQTKKKMEFDLRKETFTDALELFDLYSPISRLPNQNLNQMQQAQLDRFNFLRERVRRNLLVCGNVNEIEAYRVFRDNANTAVTNNTPQNIQAANDSFNSLRTIFTISIRREIGKKELNVTL